MLEKLYDKMNGNYYIEPCDLMPLLDEILDKIKNEGYVLAYCTKDEGYEYDFWCLTKTIEG